MKYVIVIPDGCADEPQESLGGKTPLQAAHLPNMDRIAQMGVVGRSNNVPRPLTPASDVATLSLFGYDPLQVYTGRAPLETAAMGMKLGPERLGHPLQSRQRRKASSMRDFTAGHIDSDDGQQLIAAMRQNLGSAAAGVSPRRQLSQHPRLPRPAAPSSAETKTQPPHDVPDQPIADHLPQGPGSDLLRSLMERSRDDLPQSPGQRRPHASRARSRRRRSGSGARGGPRR